MPSKPRARHRIAAAVVAGLLLLTPCCLGGLWYGERTLTGSAATLDAKIAEYRARGEPMGLTDRYEGGLVLR